MLTRNEDLSLTNLCDGGLEEAFNHHLEKLVKNCMDLNTGNKARQLIVTLKVTPNERRDEVAIDVAVDSKLLMTKTFKTAATIGLAPHGRGVMREFIKAQQSLFNVTKMQKKEDGDA